MTQIFLTLCAALLLISLVGYLIWRIFRLAGRDHEAAQQDTDAASRDPLTGLPNHIRLHDRINQAIAGAHRNKRRFAVMLVDLDAFEHINDAVGHPIGDKLLQSLATRLLGCLRGSDTVSRQGGDEFVALLSEVRQPEDAAIAARKMLRAVAEPHVIDEHELRVTASIGISVYPDDGSDAKTLVKNATIAMQEAKESGYRCYRFFERAVNVRAVRRQAIEEDLRFALERQQFALHYQPKLDLKTGAITGAEALLRWLHPTGRFVSRSEFIPVAEDCGLILPIGAWVLREACRFAQICTDAGRPLASIAVNVSAREFWDRNFLRGVAAILAETSLDPKRLELELTERVLMKDAATAASVLRGLREIGVQVAIDGLGAGYSSLRDLQDFPVRALKIDQSLVRRISAADDDPSVVVAAIEMARSLKLRAIAVGVETPAELAFLRSHQCDEAQGDYLSRPLPSEQFAMLLATGIADPFSRLDPPIAAGDR
jgi:diguanylate cyclase (GGDEF)-like protein